MNRRIHRPSALLPRGGAAVAFVSLLLVIVTLAATDSLGQLDVVRDVPCCQLDETSHAGVVYLGSDSLMTYERLASYCAPVLWFSPDEPLLRGIKDPKDINIPMAFPFQEQSEAPVVYYRYRSLLTREEGKVVHPDSLDRNNTEVNLGLLSAIDLDFFFYYPSEEGLGRHAHDVESVEMKIIVARQPGCEECRFALVIDRVVGKAHGVLWYDNTLEVNQGTVFPFSIMVEEGKHASCTDKNGDGYFTPGFDVNRRVNDAWGCRDIISQGGLFTGGFESWFAKVRTPATRVFPPLPEDSVVYGTYLEDGIYAPDNVIYSLRPWPKMVDSEDYRIEDPHIQRFVDKGYDDWPQMLEDKGTRDIGRFLEEENFVKSLSIAFRLDNDIGISFVFPLFIIRSVNEPVGGGWLVNRLIFKDTNLRDIIWNVMYTPSASRWVDTYFAAGVYWNSDGDSTETLFQTETGVKFRFNIAHSPFSFLSKVTDFWGLRVGIQYFGGGTISGLGYAIEIGAGTF